MADFNSEFFIDYSDLDDFQRQLIDRKSNKSMVVIGSAGSGKSLIALHKAKQIAALGHSYAVVVYTKTLRKYFADGLKALGLSNVYHWHEWRNMRHHVKYLIVDECQDFGAQEIDELKSDGDICLFFGDSAQSIMTFKDGGVQSMEITAQKLGIPPEPLYFNYRLTKSVAMLAEEVGKEEDLVIKCKRDGKKPYLIEADSYHAQLDRIAEVIKNASLTNVGILLPYNTSDKGGRYSVEYVKTYFFSKGITCEFKYNADKDTEMDLDFHSDNPKIMTWWCAKGLQFKDVFLPGCEYEYTPDKRAAVYVAMTRCSERLFLGYTGELNSFFPDKTSDLYES
ncbi:AAA family ATPase [Bacteroides zoogleoformans]|uniref:AAA family ATPase n=1 Tax=Bacteroides zoogleoformans TaxID=28119 RepID=UPI00248E83DD|nr:AAA family ATPase [Bacteroides zoogleoformans]